MPVFVTLFFVGVVLLMGFLPPHSPSAGPEEIAAIFRDNTTQIRFGVTVCSYAVILLAPWGIAVAMQAARAERGRPVLAITQISALSMGAFTGVLDMTVWAVAAYRPHETDADIVRLLNDFGWILFVWVIPTFTLWEIALGLAILLDKSETPAFPKGWLVHLVDTVRQFAVEYCPLLLRRALCMERHSFLAHLQHVLRLDVRHARPADQGDQQTNARRPSPHRRRGSDTRRHGERAIDQCLIE